MAGFFIAERQPVPGNISSLNKNIGTSVRVHAPDTLKSKPDSISTVKLSVVGDIMCHSTQMKYAKVAPDSFDFNPVFREIKSYLQSADLMMGNLETVFAGKVRGLKGYPVFNSPDELLFALKSAGFDHLFLSNNHVLDMGWEGLERTARLIDALGLSYSGVKNVNTNYDGILIKEINGIRVAVLSFTYFFNNKSADKSNVYTIKKSIVQNLIEKVKQKDSAEVVVVYFHFGSEYSRTPDYFQKKAVRWAVDAGADIIFASHPHVVQPLEFIASDKSVFDSVLVGYSLGNFLSNQRWRFSDGGVILSVKVNKNISTGKLSLAEVSYLPIWIYKGSTDIDALEYIVYPAYPGYFEHLPSYFSREDSAAYYLSFEDTKRALDSLGFSAKQDRIK